MPEDPDYLPGYVVVWAREKQEILDLIVSRLLETGEWPTTTGLTRDLARQGRPVPFASLLADMPRMLGFVENAPGRIVLLLPGLRLVPSAGPLLDAFVALVTLAVERYRGDEELPHIARADLAATGVTNESAQRALGEIFLREAPFYGSGTGGPEDDWTREVTDPVVEFWNIATPDEYLRIRIEQLTPKTGPLAPPPQALVEARLGEQRDVFISHAGEDKDAIARPLANALLARNHTVWFDEYELVFGDSLRRTIERGLSQSRLGVVILSESFFAKEWPQQELSALYSRLIDGEPNVIVPVWFGVDREFVAQRAPLLADLFAGNAGEGIERLADQIGRTLELRHPIADRPAQAASEPPESAPGLPSQSTPTAAEAPAATSSSPTPAEPQSLPMNIGRRPPLGAVSFDMEPGVLNIAALELVRDDDTIALQHLFNDAIAKARRAVDADSPEELKTLFDRLICLAATFLALDQDALVERVLDVMARIYGMPLRPGDAQRFGYSSQINPEEPAPALWFQILQRLYGLGALAVRYEKWSLIRIIGLQRPEGAADYEKNWLRHALTMSARAGLMRRSQDGHTVELSLLLLAREQIERLACLRQDGLAADDDKMLMSLAVFDALWNLAAIDDSGDASGRDFYPHFAQFDATRVDAAIERLLEDERMRAAVFKRSDEDLAVALRSVGALAQRDGWAVSGFSGWSPKITGFISTNLPKESA